jgi:ubiquinone/menaquinone biosynthesis C-methylase UbiE
VTTSVEQLYGSYWSDAPFDEFDAVISESLYPRGPELLIEQFRDLGVRAGEEVLDVGGRDARYAIDLVRRFDCRVVMVDPVPDHISRASAAIRAAGLDGRITLDHGQIEQLPLGAGVIDHVWCRDVLSHVDLPRGLAECARVLRPGGGMLVYQTFATPLLEPLEFRRIASALAIPDLNMSPDYFEQSARRAGFQIVAVDRIDSEWRELWLEDGDGQTTEELLKIARMRRSRSALIARYGEDRYEAMYAGALWGVYQLLGKLCPAVYLLRKPY